MSRSISAGSPRWPTSPRTRRSSTASTMPFLPMLTLVLVIVAHMMRMTRASVLAVMASPYIEMAILKGLTQDAASSLRHALPNALAPIISVVALNLAYLIVGVVVVETVFVYPGLGQLMVDEVVQARRAGGPGLRPRSSRATFIGSTCSADMLAHPRPTRACGSRGERAAQMRLSRYHKLSVAARSAWRSSPINLFVAIFAPLIAPYGQTRSARRRLGGPRRQHWLGLDNLGRDISEPPYVWRAHCRSALRCSLPRCRSPSASSPASPPPSPAAGSIRHCRRLVDAASVDADLDLRPRHPVGAGHLRAGAQSAPSPRSIRPASSAWPGRRRRTSRPRIMSRWRGCAARGCGGSSRARCCPTPCRR